jgi:hypothetical protein
MTDGDRRRKDIGRCPEVKIAFFHIPDGGRHCKQHAAVKDEAAFPYLENIQRII